MLITDQKQCAGCINHGGDQFSCDFIKLHYQRCAGTSLVNYLFFPNVALCGASGADGPTSIFLAGKLTGGENQVAEYTSITMEDAKEIFQEKGDYLIVDVRRADEFAEGHIPGAINIANEDIVSSEPAELPDKDQVIYVYCRSGNRSKQASAKLAAMGYTNIVEFGGILDWTGEVER